MVFNQSGKDAFQQDRQAGPVDLGWRDDSTNAKGNFEFVRQVRFREKRD